MAKLSVIGLDGVNWKILENAVELGLMPNLESLMEESYTAELETTYPPVTGPAWTSIMTGDNPGKHGIYDFVNHVEEGRPYNASDIKSQTVYEAIESYGGETCLVNLPMSYPPRSKGKFVGSFLAPEDDFVRPESLEQVYDFSDYKKSISALEKTFSVVDSATETAEDKKKLLDFLLEDQEFFFLLFSAPDWVMHNKYHVMENLEDENAFQPFKTIDDAIGTVRARSDNIILLSDHGFKTYKNVFYVNQWLEEHGYLETEGSMEAAWVDNIFIDKVIEVATSSKVLRKLTRKLYLSVESYVPLPDNVKVRLRGALSEGIDFESSKAFCPSSDIEGVYVNDERFENVVEDKGRLVRSLKQELPDRLDPAKASEVYSGEEMREAPDIVLRSDEYKISRGIFGSIESGAKLNHHGREGFFLAKGENFSTGEGDISLYDFAPTVAELFGVNFEADGEELNIVQERSELNEISGLDL
ncbi:MAG: alkaline phosphatase family protein [Candidatus Nanohaloarchaea archaeon]